MSDHKLISKKSPSPFKSKPDIKVLNLYAANTAVSTLGIEFTEIGDDYLTATMPVDSRTKQPYGLLHGGASVLLAETLGSVAANLCLEDSADQAVGVEINANHIRAVREGIVTGTARPIKVGRQLQVWQIEIFNEENQLICVSRLTLAIMKARPS